MDAETKVRRTIAKLKLSTNHTDEFYSTILMGLKHKTVKNMGTIGTDGRTLLYDPDFVLSLTPEEVVGCLVHEAEHILRRHMLRCKDRDKTLWNVACDMENNHQIAVHGRYVLPADVVPGKEGLAEKHYKDILDNVEEMPGGVGCGMQSPELEEGEDIAEVESEIVGNVRRALMQAEHAGKLPAGMERFVEEYLEPKVSWKTVLADFVETQRAHENSWKNPRRQWLNRHIFLPGHHTEETLSDIGIAVDTSGSVTNDRLIRVYNEVRYILSDIIGYNKETPLVWFDTKAHVDIVTSDDTLVPKGGGGTDFSVVVPALAKFDINGLVIITDGYCNRFGVKPDYPVIWCVYGGCAFNPPFGKVIQLKEFTDV